MKASKSVAEHSATCKTCSHAKPLTEYYDNSKGGKQTECKDCMKARAKRNYRPEIRAERDEAEANWQSWGGNIYSVDMYNQTPIEGGYWTAPCRT